VPSIEPLAQQAAVVPAAYLDVAKRMLWDRTRDSTVVEPAPPAPAPPPPMPPLPAFHGLLNFGSGGPIALLSVGTAGMQAIHEGDRIGPFKLLAVNREVISFEWNQETVHRNTRDLAGAAQPLEPTDGPVAPPPPPPKPLTGPGADTGRGSKACNVNDGNAAGAVVDGYRKAVFSTPFGQSCAWEPAK
jgi:hypothetical protein